MGNGRGGRKRSISKCSVSVTVVPSLAAAQDVLKDLLEKGDTVLFLNDLPDIY